VLSFLRQFAPGEAGNATVSIAVINIRVAQRQNNDKRPDAPSIAFLFLAMDGIEAL